MDDVDMTEEIAMDLREAEELFSSCQRPVNKRLLESHVANLKAKQSKATTAAPAVEQKPVKLANTPVAAPVGIIYENLESFAWDQGEYNSQWVTVYLTSGLDGLGKCKECVTCDFTESTFDLKILDFKGKNFRLYKDNLDKDIIPAESKFTVKKNGVTIKLKKKKGEYSYEHWTDLTSKKSKDQKKADTDNPMGGIMDMMKEMYDNGDDQMKKTIGEAMEKSRNGGGKMDTPDLDKFDD